MESEETQELNLINSLVVLAQQIVDIDLGKTDEQLQYEVLATDNFLDNQAELSLKS
jgi:hypothetical protein